MKRGGHLTRRLLAAGLLAGLAAACGPVAPALQGEELAPEDVLAVGQRLEAAPALTAHAGLRRVRSEYVTEDGPESLVYDERFVTDGRGNYALDVVDVLEGAGPDFALRQKVRVGFTSNYRDFRVRDLELFLQNYVVLQAGAEVFVAGRRCTEIVAHRPGTERVYTVAMDVATGLVLRYEETDLAGDPIASMEYLTFEENPDVSGVAWQRPLVEQRSVSCERLLADADELLGFEPKLPSWLPDGYRMADVSVLVDPLGRGKWARVTYTDGVENVFYLHGGLDADAAAETAAELAVEGAQPLPEGELQLYEIAPLTVVQGTLDDERVIAMGKVDGDTLIRLVGSSL